MRYLGVLFLKFISLLIWISPRKLQLFYGDLFAYLWFDVLRIRRKVIFDNLEIAFPGMEMKEKIRIGRSSLKNMGRSLVEYFMFPYINKDNIDDYFECSSWPNYEKVIQNNKGCLILSLHIGSYDFFAAYLAIKGMDIRLISKEMRNKNLNDLWFGIRESMGVKFISDRKAKFEIIKGLKEKAAVGFIIDQFAGPPIGIKSEFMGVTTGTAYGLALYHLWTKAPVVPMYNYRRFDNKIEAIIGDSIELEEKDTRDETILHMTNKYNKVLEKIIREHPEQWLWVHKRWKEFKH